MERRRLLGLVAVGLSSGCLSGLPGTTGPRNPPEAPADKPRETPEVPPVRISTVDFESTDDGRVRVFGEVVNDAGSERVATVEVRIEVDDEESVKTKKVTVASGGKTAFETEFDVSYDAFKNGGELNASLV
ncbi:transcriptional initiation protein Tat [Haloferax mediterranei ATCC 33500]|uniref:Transcriptional initiation protein Tat n=1 Tax=Haloferax mediterranei (strain ATCC 33500 / DSM 1411 / JCM 8866 / NBRC 14739 / NCIMB 2177 / R-4) TaxID=523841 RepID=I3R552_HALMT|nr:hypothetical protein [Haloferax mediterranei]AFK19362.1 hypothetical protein HFX_1656 [Haloferax mediterranei ATCC 33500]AHZ21285.1 transcriptional initiation protein Tat [Haloferax mediterranei ATCC 33500]EMA04447.1 hypothetical protein C439_02192 [Haloferax mediterranei ATCC 33500]MDX5989466.1 transcriptional initiation protein Tat [Haloferax mediterranei ATCC 33500]QCQ75828.1 transcriptional initiation protein Tat [Haloferax mediterranei ATCC 33500]